MPLCLCSGASWHLNSHRIPKHLGRIISTACESLSIWMRLNHCRTLWHTWGKPPLFEVKVEHQILLPVIHLVILVVVNCWPWVIQKFSLKNLWSSSWTGMSENVYNWAFMHLASTVAVLSRFSLAHQKFADYSLAHGSRCLDPQNLIILWVKVPWLWSDMPLAVPDACKIPESSFNRDKIIWYRWCLQCLWDQFCIPLRGDVKSCRDTRFWVT